MTEGAQGIDPITELARAVRRGDDVPPMEREARERLLAFCAVYLGRREGAEDVVQEALARLIAEAREPKSPRPWLLRVVRNLCLDRRRALGAGPGLARLASSFDAARDSAGPLTRLVGAEADAEVHGALECLSAEERELLRLRYGDDLPRAEVAAIVELPESLVKSRLFEAIQKLRRALGSSS